MRGPVVGTALRRAVVRHVLLTALVTVVVSVLVTVGVVIFAGRDAYRSAELVARQVGSAVIVPLSRHDFRGPIDPVRADLTGDVEPFLASGMIQRVKVWTVSGDTARIAYSDERRVEGETGTLDPGTVARLASGESPARPVPDDAEHRFETPRADALLEVFVGFRDAGGNPARLEVYVPVDRAGTIRATAAAVLPMLLGGLALLAVATLPLSVALGRRIERERAEQRAVRRYGLAAAEAGRRDLARHLHDGVIPDLAGAGLLIETVRAERSGDAGRELLDHAHDLVTGEVRELRILLDGLVVPEPVDHDLAEALHRLAARRRPLCPGEPPRVDIEVDIEVGGGTDGESVLLVHQVAGELLTNAFRHAGARRVRVSVARAGPAIRLTVADDGIGFHPDRARRTGHVGLMLVRRALADHGGHLAVTSAPGAGTTVTATVTAEPAGDDRRPSGVWRNRLRHILGTRHR